MSDRKRMLVISLLVAMLGIAVVAMLRGLFDMVTLSGMPVPMLKKQFVARAGPKTLRTSFQSLYLE